MTAPRHLWSGDWRRESAAAARELAERRAQDDEPTAVHDPAPTEAKAPAPARPEQRAREGAAPKPRDAPAPAPAPKPRAIPAPARDPRARESVAAQARATATAPRRSPTPPRARTEGGWRSWHGSRFAVVFLAVLVSGGIAYAAVSTLVGSNNSSATPPISQANRPSQAAPAANGPAWLGVQTQSAASAGGGFSSGSGTGTGTGNSGLSSGAGAVVTNVVPGSPADAAGLEPGDVITQIDNQTVNSPDDINSALAGMHVGQQVEIQYQRGPFADAAQVTLAARPAGSP
jgi:hypothetical protein